MACLLNFLRSDHTDRRSGECRNPILVANKTFQRVARDANWIPAFAGMTTIPIA
jgi:hypothetical protein